MAVTERKTKTENRVSYGSSRIFFCNCQHSGSSSTRIFAVRVMLPLYGATVVPHKYQYNVNITGGRNVQRVAHSPPGDRRSVHGAKSRRSVSGAAGNFNGPIYFSVNRDRGGFQRGRHHGGIDRQRHHTVPCSGGLWNRIGRR